MKRLILMRHAKSAWGEPALRDIDRPLNARGRKSAAALGDWLRARAYLPDRALISTAQRTRETWEGLALKDCPADFLPALYGAPPEVMLAALGATEPAADAVLLIAHNPGVAGLARFLLGAAPAPDGLLRYPTGATSIFDLVTDDWGDAHTAPATLADFVLPRSLTDR